MNTEKVWMLPCGEWHDVERPMSMVISRMEGVLQNTTYFPSLDGIRYAGANKAERRAFDFNFLSLSAVELGHIPVSSFDGVDFAAYDIKRLESSRARFPRLLNDTIIEINNHFQTNIHWCLYCEDIDLYLANFQKFANTLRKHSWLSLYIPESEFEIAKTLGLRNVFSALNENIKIGFPAAFNGSHTPEYANAAFKVHQSCNEDFPRWRPRPVTDPA